MEEPVKIRAREFHRGLLVHRQRGCDVEQHHFVHSTFVIERQAMCDARAAIVCHHVKAIVAQHAHDFRLVARHLPLGIVRVIRRALRLAAVAVAAQIGCHNRIALGQQWNHLIPLRGASHDSMNQQHHRTPVSGCPVADPMAMEHDLVLGWLQLRKHGAPTLAGGWGARRGDTH